MRVISASLWRVLCALTSAAGLADNEPTEAGVIMLPRSRHDRGAAPSPEFVKTSNAGRALKRFGFSAPEQK